MSHRRGLAGIGLIRQMRQDRFQRFDTPAVPLCIDSRLQDRDIFLTDQARRGTALLERRILGLGQTVKSVELLVGVFMQTEASIGVVECLEPAAFQLLIDCRLESGDVLV